MHRQYARMVTMPYNQHYFWFKWDMLLAQSLIFDANTSLH
jgi:hypothetical protein